MRQIQYEYPLITTKMDLKWSLLDVSSRLGLGKTAVTLHDNLTDQFAEIDIGIQDTSKSKKNDGRVLFPLFEGGARTHMFRTGVLAHAFRTRGYEPYLIICDAELDLCHKKEKRDGKPACDLCKTRGLNRAKEFGLEPHLVSELLPANYEPPEIIGIGPEKHHGVNIRDYAMASSRRYLRKYSVNLDDKSERMIFRRFLRSALISVDALQTAFDQYSFDAMVAHHPAYVIGGVLMEVAEQHDVPAYSHSSGYRQQNIIFGMARNRSPMAQFSNEKLVRDRLSTELTDDEREWVNDFMRKRASGEDTRAFYAKNAGKNLSTQDVGVTVGLFTNLMWDGSLSAENIAFDDPFEWLQMTIDWFRQHSESRLIIKTHPAEEMRGTEQGVYDWISQQYNLEANDFSNIEVLKPNTDIDPYSLINQIDAGVVYNSTIGMEMAHEGVPVIVVGDTHYRDLGFTYDPDDERAYKQLLSKIGSVEMTAEMIDRTKRYLHLLFNENHIHFQYHTYKNGSASFNRVTHEEINSDENLDLIVDRMVNGEPVSYRSLP